MTIRRAALVAMAALWAMTGGAMPVAAADWGGFDRPVGPWSCDGYFVKSGAKIASSLDVSRDSATGALTVRHDDTGPNIYHAPWVWTSSKGVAPFRAAIANSGGMRRCTSDGWSMTASPGADRERANPRGASPIRSAPVAICRSIG